MDGVIAPAASSVLASLCREAQRLRWRAGQLMEDLGRCQSPPLRQRLWREMAQLRERRAELQRIAALLRGAATPVDGVALALFEELTARPLSPARCGA